MFHIKIIFIYLIIINFISFIQMGIDKYKAKKGLWRISEQTLFVFAIIGGSIGSLLGMHWFRHKTKHLKFTIGMSIILLLQLGLGYFLIEKGIM